MESSKAGFLEALMDFSFTHFVTIRVIAVLYGLALAGVAITSLTVFMMMSSISNAFVALLVTPLFFCLGILMVRMYLEVTVVLFRIAENSTALREMGNRMANSPADGVLVK